jgi:hypothetical protein
VAQGPPAGLDRPGLDLAQLADRHLRPLGELFLGQASLFAQLPDSPAQGDVLWFSELSHSSWDGTGDAGVATSAVGALPDLTVAVGNFAHPALGLGCVGDGEACEESHGCLLSRVRHWLNRFASVPNTS